MRIRALTKSLADRVSSHLMFARIAHFSTKSAKVKAAKRSLVNLSKGKQINALRDTKMLINTKSP